MDRLESIEAFVAVVQSGGFSAAARAHGVPVATVSRRVAQLEESMGVPLLVRSTRHVAPTEAGQRYFDVCVRMLEELRDAQEAIMGEHRSPKGLLTITAPLGFGRMHVHPLVIDFLNAYPDIRVDLRLTDKIVPLIEDQIDCAVRINSLKDSTLVAREVGHVRMLICASPQYLLRRGTPRALEDLLEHDCIAWTSLVPFKAWEVCLTAGDPTSVGLAPIRVRFSTTAADAAVDAAANGLGLVQATSYQLAPLVRAGALLPVLRAHEPPVTPINLVITGRRMMPLKLRAFVDHCAPRLRQRVAELGTIAPE
jgi:DNA-binding transcriptional LysR family regulator